MSLEPPHFSGAQKDTHPDKSLSLCAPQKQKNLVCFLGFRLKPKVGHRKLQAPFAACWAGRALLQLEVHLRHGPLSQVLSDPNLGCSKSSVGQS